MASTLVAMASYYSVLKIDERNNASTSIRVPQQSCATSRHPDSIKRVGFKVSAKNLVLGDPSRHAPSVYSIESRTS